MAIGLILALFETLCAPCHGAHGDGHGPAAPWVWPAPRDLTKGDFVFGAQDADVEATIRWGIGDVMPGFGEVLTQAQVDELVKDVRAFAGKAPKPPKTRPIPDHAGDASLGSDLWHSAGCDACHKDGPPPLRRPHSPGDERWATMQSIAYGAGEMPSFVDALGDQQIWDLVAYVGQRGSEPWGVPGPLAPEAIAADRASPLASGTWPGTDPDEGALFGGAIAPQGDPPASLAPAEASLSSRRCGRCHAKQVREWKGSIHGAAFSAGFRAQLTRQDTDAGRAGCMKCHAPLPEQRDDATLEAQGVTCAVCHVRGWTRHGPPQVAPTLATIASYPFQPLAIYERSDLCLACHQLPARLAVAGRPLLDTYREWLRGPYMRRGVQCQSCHMPDREHQFRGVHDADTFREGIDVRAIAARTADGVVSVRARLYNVGAGHLLPTTATPAAWLAVELVDARGKPIAGARAEQRIGRDIAFANGAWVERADTRVAPGEFAEVAGGWTDGRVDEAARVRVTVRVSPDEYYEQLYRRRVAHTTGATHDLYQQALDRAAADEYVAEDFLVDIEDRTK